jgi:Las17-binding protein actin regulator
MHTIGLGFLFGIDIYDTVLVLRTQEAVNAFAHPKVSIGAELSVAAGPLGSGGGADIGFKDKAPAWVYTKSKGFYAGIALDGTVVVERHDENARFYGQKIRAADLIKGAVSRPKSTDGLVAAIAMAEGRTAGQDYRVLGGLSPPFEQGGWSEPEYSHDKAPPLPARRNGDSSTYDQPTAGSSRLEAPFSSVPGTGPGIVPPLPARRSPTPQGDTYSGKDKEYRYDSKSDAPYADAPPAYSDDDIKIGDNRSTEKRID